jgi:hypothetical protein
VALGQVNFGITETWITGVGRLGLVAVGQVNFGITETGITGVHQHGIVPTQLKNEKKKSKPT